MNDKLDDFPKYLFCEGTNSEAYKFFSPKSIDKSVGAWQFRTYAPNAKSVSIVGDFNGWESNMAVMTRDDVGIWTGVVEGAKAFDNYKFLIERVDGKFVKKADPYALHCETSPGTASKLYELGNYNWSDKDWLAKREKSNPYKSPMNVYEVNFGSWRKNAEGGFFSYRMLAEELVSYVKKMNFTHIEIMPITEYPFDGSWGYQVTGLFAPTSRFGTPDDFKYLIDRCHQNGIGVILDWVVAHFPKDEHGLYMYDGTPLFEYADPKKGEHKEWGTMVFDYGKGSVKSFLISSANFWLSEYHIDGLRVDAVASMLYLDYGRKNGEWIANKNGSNHNLEAIDFIKQLNTTVLTANKGVLMIAEESTSFPMVTKPSYDGGLGFNFKWNMGWMNDMLCYVGANPFFRKDMHDKMTFSISYAFSENYVLPLSHDEVVHGKKSLLDKMQGTYDEKFCCLKAFLGYMMAHPGKKLLFMGGEIAQFIEWDYKKELDWFLLQYPQHKYLQKFVADINAFYLENPCLYELDCESRGFEWICVDDKAQNIAAFARRDEKGNSIVAVINFSPIERPSYKMGVPNEGTWQVEFCSNGKKYGGEETTKRKYVAKAGVLHNQKQYIKILVPAYSVMFLKLKD